jgi:flagellar motor switch protein FliN/FliY
MTDTSTDDDFNDDDDDQVLLDADTETENLSLDEIESGEDAHEDEHPVLGGHEQEEEVIRTAADLEAVYDVPVQVSAVLGKTRMEVSQLLKLGRGAVVELDRKVGEAIDIYVNNRLVARGEVVVVEERLGVTMTEIIKTDRS